MTFKYFDKFDSVAKARYVSKLNLIGLKECPHKFPAGVWKDDPSKWPSVEYGVYTSETMKNYKSLEAHNYFRSGRVETVFMCKPNVSEHTLHKAYVKPSQKLNEENYSPWVAATSSGQISAAHCNCMAGLSWAACSFSSKSKVVKSPTGAVTTTNDNKSGKTLPRGMWPESSGKMQSHAVRYKKPKYKFLLQGVDTTQYTHKPIPYSKTGGRGWNGRVFNKRIGGGAKQMYRMVDFTRQAVSETEPLAEKVLFVRYDPLRSADIALVASGNHKRWILASDTIKAGDVIHSHAEIPKLPVSPKIGDAYPLGALPIGTSVHNIEMYEKEGGHFARAAGTCGVIMQKTMPNRVIVRLPSGLQASLNEKCIATVGKVSNVDHNTQHIGSAQRNRWFGVRPKSGLFQKKTGYHGRKIKPPKPLITYEKKTKKPLHEMFDT